MYQYPKLFNQNNIFNANFQIYCFRKKQKYVVKHIII